MTTHIFGATKILPKTYQTTVYYAGDDGTYQAGSPANPRYIVNTLPVITINETSPGSGGVPHLTTDNVTWTSGSGDTLQYDGGEGCWIVKTGMGVEMGRTQAMSGSLYPTNQDGIFGDNGAVWDNFFESYGTAGGTPATVFDRATSLEWLANPSLVSVTSDTLPNAITFCEGLNFFQKADWRLPNIKELHSLLEMGLMGGVYNDVFNWGGYTFWSSTSNDGDYYFGMDCSNGEILLEGVAASYYITAVRGGGI